MTLRTKDTRAAPLVILSMDAGDPGFIRRWAEEGYLPNIAGLMRGGCWGSVVGPDSVCEIGTGITLFSGVSRARHGYYDIRQLKPGTYELGPTTPDHAKTVPFWAHLRDREQRVLIIDPFEVNVQPGVAGLQVNYWRSYQAAYPVLPAVASPPDLLTEILQNFGPAFHLRDFIPDVQVTEDRAAYQALLDSIALKGKLCRHLLQKGPFDLTVIGFSEMHGGAHRFWPYRAEARSESARPGDPVLTHAIRDIYQAIDREFGLILEMLPAGSNVVFVGMFGMEDQYPTMGLGESFCRLLGYQASPQGKAAFRPLSLARRLLPLSVRRALGRLLSNSRNEQVLAQQFRTGNDWRRTTAFAIPSLYDTYVRVNSRGREPNGIVEPGKEYVEVLDRLEADLAQLIDPRTDQPAVAKTYRAVDLFGDVPDALPDLLVSWRPHTHFLRRLVHPKGEITQAQPQYFRDSFHRKGGLLVATGPAIQARGDVGQFAPLDLAPTFLSLLGESVPDRMTGRVLTSLIGGVM